MNSPPTRKLNRAWNPMTTECRVPSFGCDYRQNVKSPPNRDPAPIGDPKVHVGRIVPAVPSLHPNQRGTIRQSKTQTNMTAAQQNDRNKRSVSFVEPKTTEENGGGNHRHNSRSSPSPGPSGNSLRHTNLYDNFREMKPATSEDRAHWRHASAWNSPAQQPTFAGPSTNLSNPVFESIPVSSEPASDSQPKHYASAGQLDQTLTNLGLFNSQPPANPLYICSLPIQALQSEHLLPYQQQSVVGTTTTFVQQPVPLQPQVTIVATDPAALRAILMSAIPGQTMFQTPVTLPQSAHSSGPQYHAPGHSVQPVYHAPTTPSPVQPCNQNAIPMPPLHVVRPPVSTIAQQMSNESTTAQSIKQPAEKELSPHIPKSAQTEGYQRSGDRQTTTRPLQGDVLIQSRHTTKISDQSVENIHPPCDVREQCQNIWHPPRTLRYRAQPELIENSLFADDGVKHNLSTSPNYREPKKLDPESFIHRARMDSGPREEAFDANTFPPPITTTPLNDPNSISAYYERLKRRSNRQVNAHRPKSTFIGGCHDEDKRRAHEQLKAPIVRQHTSTAEHEALGRNLSKPMKRAVTFSPDQIEIPKQSDQVEECSKQAGKDPSIMTVAERARRWIEGRQRDERQRYSTCGFIDQDLIDCDDIVTVEDRVKMFDSAISGRLDDQIPDRLQLVEAPTTLQSGSKTPQAKNGNTLVGKASTPGKAYVLGNEPVVHKSSQSNHRLPASNTGGKLKDTVNKFEPNDPSNMSVGEKRRLFSQAGQSKIPGGRPVGRRKTQPVTLDDLARANELIVARLNGCDLGL